MTPGRSANLSDPGRTRTYNPRLRRPMPYPLGHGARQQFLAKMLGVVGAESVPKP